MTPDWSTLGVWAGVLLTIGTLVTSALMAVGSIASRAIWRAIEENTSAGKLIAQQYNDNRVQIETATNTLLATKLEVKDVDGRATDRLRRLEDSLSVVLCKLAEIDERLKSLERANHVEQHNLKQRKAP